MYDNRLAIASVSLGLHPAHTLPQKIVAAARAGISGIEITYSDLNDYARSVSLSLLEAARDIRQLCEVQSLFILAFASFQNFEGQQTPLHERLQKASEWLAITNALGAAHLQVPSNYDRGASGEPNVIRSELQQLADLAKSFNPPIKIAYENLGWGTHCHLWQQALEIVRQVDRENFGLCLDSFHFSVALWADPYSPTGIQPNGDRQLEDSLRELVTQLPLEKLFYLQLSDGEKLNPPYSEKHPWFDPALQPGHVWSNEARPFPLETEYGSYMPVWTIAHAFLVELGYTGWVSMETFDRRMKSEGEAPSKSAQRARNSWDALKSQLAAPKPISSRL
ncbi:xylose isomerase-like protein [Hortaea werneckii]|nr:xylose isomerase-like protein [Hortaea werneckii]KAI7026921.1 xylose isomerase-like protein [Hortaea werneckii]KAI7203256.1 xylose isomerase-like protein [Hortaea werneckii]KAI7594024.1 xylose isomerase-like protein [Hortaea werneckii]KAI7676034.1 xylose isomerase-like protein [Hortaea werneckii]